MAQSLRRSILLLFFRPWPSARDGESSKHHPLGHTQGVRHRGEPADQAQPAGALHQLLAHPHLPAPHLHHRSAVVRMEDDVWKRNPRTQEQDFPHFIASFHHSVWSYFEFRIIECSRYFYFLTFSYTLSLLQMSICLFFTHIIILKKKRKQNLIIGYYLRNNRIK